MGADQQVVRCGKHFLDERCRRASHEELRRGLDTIDRPRDAIELLAPLPRHALLEIRRHVPPRRRGHGQHAGDRHPRAGAARQARSPLERRMRRRGRVDVDQDALERLHQLPSPPSSLRMKCATPTTRLTGPLPSSPPSSRPDATRGRRRRVSRDATGTLQAVTTVQVGTQVSGTIKRCTPTSTQVRRGQVIAELEPSLFRTQVEQARASIVRLQAEARRARVQSDNAQQQLKRARELSESQLIPATDLENCRSERASSGGGRRSR
jgi:hypothetical protein